MGWEVKHKQDIYINKEKLKRKIMEKKLGSYQELLRRLKTNYGIDLQYKGFMTLLSNHSTWKLLYAVAIVETLETTMEELFEWVEVE